MNCFKSLQVLASASIILGVQTLLPAQAAPAEASTPATAPAPAVKAKTTAADDDVVQLDAFQVTGKSENGYLASEATSGTRYAASIMETPISVQVITSDFINDFSAFDMTGQDMVSYTSSFTPTDGTGNINLRGIRGSSVYKNGIREGGVLGPASIDRTEIIRGSNAAIYGQTEPSGMVNRITKKAQTNPFQEVRLYVGDKSYTRAQLDVNQPLIPGELLGRVAISQEYSKFGAQDFALFRRTNPYGSITWKIDPMTSLTINAEYIKMRAYTQNAGQMPTVLVAVPTLRSASGTVTSAVYQAVSYLGMGRYEKYKYVNYNGPTAYNNLEYSQIDATLSHRFSSWLSAQLKGALWDRVQGTTTPSYASQAMSFNASSNNRVFIDHNPYDASFTDPNAGTIRGYAVPQLARNRGSKEVAQVDMLASFKTGPVSHKLLLTGDFASEIAYSSARRLSTSTNAANLVNMVPLNNYLTHTGVYQVPGFDYDAEYHNPIWAGSTAYPGNIGTDLKSTTITKGYMLSERMGFFKDRVLLLFGGRHDQINRTARNKITKYLGSVPLGQQYYMPTEAQWTYQTGINVRATEGFSLYANASSSFVPSNGTSQDINGALFPASKGRGQEAGAKIDILNDKLTFTAGLYNIYRSNQLRTQTDEYGNSIASNTGASSYSVANDVHSRGVELDGIWRPVRAISTTFFFSYSKINYTSIGLDDNTINRNLDYLYHVRPDTGPTWTGGFTAGYKFYSGWLKGFGVRTAVRWQGRSVVAQGGQLGAYSIYGNSHYQGPKVLINNVPYQTYYFESSSYIRWDAYLEYRWNNTFGSNKFQSTLTIGVTNILNQNTYLVSAKPPDPCTFQIGYVIKH